MLNRLGEGMCQLYRKVTLILANQSYAKGEMTEQTYPTKCKTQKHYHLSNNGWENLEMYIVGTDS
jgi:hypothetical protein